MAADRISQAMLDRYNNVSVATVFSGVGHLGYEPSLMRGVRTFTPGVRLAARARTLRFVPPRKDVLQETQLGEGSPQYRAMDLCGPGDVLVCDGMGVGHAAVGGDVTFLQLHMAEAEGIVTDASIRDLDAVKAYGLKLFAAGRTPGVGAPDIWPYEPNVTIGCGGVAVRPGDLVVGDDDGVVVVAKAIVEELIEWAEEHDEAEEYIKGLVQREGVSPGKHYTPETLRRFHEERQKRA